MIDPPSRDQLREAITVCICSDRGLLNAFREEIRSLKQATRKIRLRAATLISLVCTDGGNNQPRFHPYLIQLIRVADNSDNESA